MAETPVNPWSAMAPCFKSNHRLEHTKYHTGWSYCTNSHWYHQDPQQALRNIVHRKTNVEYTTNSIAAKKVFSIHIDAACLTEAGHLSSTMAATEYS